MTQEEKKEFKRLRKIQRTTPFRKFLGKVSPIGMSNIDHKHLKAYLSGDLDYTYGFNQAEFAKGKRIPQWYKVLFEVYGEN